MTQTTGATAALARFVSTLRVEDVPAPVVRIAKDIVVDSIGCVLAGTRLGPATREVLAVAAATSGPGPCRLLGLSRMADPRGAAFVHGALVHSLNYDAVGAGIACFPAQFAVGEAIGASGADVLAGVIAGGEVAARVASAISRTGVHPSGKFLAGQLFGYFGAAAGAARVLRLDEAKTASALGFALMQAAGSMQPVLEGDPPGKAIYGGFSAQGGVIAALLAAEGLDARCDVFEGKAGLVEMVYGGRYDAHALAGDLGRDFRLMESRLKPWPSSIQTHPCMDAARILREEGVDVSSIVRIVAVAPPHARPWCEPIVERRRPANAAGAGDSIPYGVAKILVRGNLALGDLAEPGLRDAEAHRVADRIECRIDAAVKGGALEVAFANGSTRSISVEAPLGHPANPMSSEQVRVKFADCCANARSPLTPERSAAVADAVARLETLDRVDRITRLAT